MKKILGVLYHRFEIKREKKIREVIAQFSLTEKVIFTIFAGLMILGSFLLFSKANNALKIDIPRYGGEMIEGIVGSPRFINPVLSVSDADKDVTTLIYSGLMKINASGEIMNDLALSYSISNDNLTYTFKIRDNAEFHNGSPVTTDDIIFTINKILDSSIKSPKRANWEGVTVEKINEKEIKFILKKPYAPFLEVTTVGILSKNIWKNISNENFPFSTYNIEPIGSGPYTFNSIERDPDGTILSYTLKSFNKYVGGRPNIKNIILNFYPNEETLLNKFKNGSLDSISGINPHTASKTDGQINVYKIPLARTFGVYFNQNQSPALRMNEVRTALVGYINRERIINESFYGFAKDIKSPIPPIISELSTLKAYPDSVKDYDLENAKNILIKSGWTVGTDGVLEKKVKKGKETETTRLEFTLTTGNIPDLKKTAEILKEDWEKIGVKVNIKIFETGELNQNVIRPRKFDALLFGQVVGRDLDLYSYWHSSQRNDPGLNIAMYTNSESDKILESIRNTFDIKERNEKIIKWVSVIKNDIPAIFLYSPEFIYEINTRVKGINESFTSKPADRWNGVEKWYVETDKIWKILVK